MNRLEEKFAELKRSKKKALSVFLTAGYPSLASTEKLILELEKRGVDFFEIGFPFSDPIADGSTIQKSSQTALKNGMTWEKLLNLCKNVRKRSQTPLILMSYANPLYCRGWKKAVLELDAAGFDGVIVPDLIPEEGRNLQELFRQQELCLIYLVSPTSSDERIRNGVKQSSGCVYCVSVTGITGARNKLPLKEIQSFLRRVKKISALPILLGFGISRVQHLKKLKNSADGFVIGSALIKNLKLKALIPSAKNFILPFARGIQ